MAFKVKQFEGMHDLESLQVAKLDYFALERASYRPYSQARLCFSPEGLHLQLLSFEAVSPPDSFIEGVLALADVFFRLRLYADGRHAATVSSQANTTPLPDVTMHPFLGEDLQGVYWGGTFHLPYFSHTNFTAKPGATFTGNFYKICEIGELSHHCSFYPADFSRPLTAAENLGEMILIDY